MYLLAPIAFAILAYPYLFSRLRESGCKTPVRDSLLAAAVVVGVAVAAITEVLSLFEALATVPVFLAWCTLAVAAGVLLRGRLRWPELAVKRPTWTGALAGAAVAGILGTTLLIALVSPPNNWDSMTYHMPRVMHWAEAGNLSFHATSEPRELWPYPWAEYAILHLQLLSGSDRFANLVQWLASVVSVVGVSLIVSFFTVQPMVQLVGSLVCASVPMGIMESTSTQNDYVAACWLVCFVYFMLRFSEDRGHWFWYGTAAGSALGLGVLTKPTVAFYAAGFLPWVLLRNRARKRIGPSFGAAALVGVISLTICSGHLVRLQGFSYDKYAAAHVNAEFSVRATVSTLLRSLTLHTGTSWPEVNGLMADAVTFLHRPLGLDVSDPLTTQWPGTVFYDVRRPRSHEDHAGNPWHLLLFALALGVCSWLAIQRRRARQLLLYGLAIVVGALLICLVGRWAPWNSRFHLPLFVLAGPFIAVSLSWFRKGPVLALVTAFLVVVSVPHLTGNESRPLKGPRNIFGISREQALFNNRPDLYGDYVAATEVFARTGCRDLGIVPTEEVWEYPIWVLTSRLSSPPPVVRHVTFTRDSSRYGPVTIPPPCAVIAHTGLAANIQIGGQRFSRSWESPSLFLYEPVGGPTGPQ